ncbi:MULTISPECIES: FHA domain-containing protein [Arthrobacter]|uniref:FHA domain-containing protein n=2 Tax=Arthrobacter TaxID=1663 RepID=A0ABU9KIM6_9MICC|nr:FHA domain-containing protein [Arthrobacter sp. YJM1]MDP5226232.1 FHA domain-containing protein [Arthrobacter sp. YJM1]
MSEEPSVPVEPTDDAVTDGTSTDTTSVFLPVLSGMGASDPQLSADDVASIGALPHGSALLIAHGGPNAGSRFLLDTDRVTVGRHPDADIFLDDVTVSRKHAEFVRTPSGYELVDTGSLNGSYVNHDRVDRVLLKSGAEVQIGKFRLSYYPSPARPASGH